jgi:hypothetical protein
MKYKGKRISGPPLGARTGPKKNSSRGKDPWVISYRTSHERARSANPMRSYSASDSQSDLQTDGQTKRGHKRIENTLKNELRHFEFTHTYLKIKFCAISLHPD